MLRDFESTASARSCWIISDGKAGVETQCLAVADQLNIETTLKRVAPGKPWRWLAPHGPVAPSEGFGKPGSTFAPPWPDLVIAGGRMTVPYVRALGHAAGPRTFTVFLQDPRTNAATADLIWVPQHDRRRGDNVFVTLTTPHRLTLETLSELRNHVPPYMAEHPEPRLSVLIGGDSRSHTFTEKDQTRLIASLEALAPHFGSVYLTPSRRTPPALSSELQQFMQDRPGLCWDGSGENPLHNFIAQADHLVVTSDSANMVCETCVSGRPVHVFHPSGGTKKFDRLHRALEAYGATRALQETYTSLESWTYEPLSSTEVIGDEIKRRWVAHLNTVT